MGLGRHRCRVPRLSDARLTDAVLVGVAAAWGSTYLAAKQLLPSPDLAPVLVAARMVVAAALLGGWLALRRAGRPTAGELRAGVATGLVLAAVFAGETYGVTLTSATNAGVLISLTMVLTPAVEAVVRRRAPGGAFLAVAGVAVLGAGLLATDGHPAAPRAGDLLILAAALLRAGHVTALGAFQESRPLDPRRLTAVQLGTVAVVFVVLTVALGAPVGAFVSGLHAGGGALLAYLAVVCTVGAFAAQTWAVGRTSPSHVGLLLGTEPVWAAVLGLLLAHDRLGPVGVAGVVVTLAAVSAARRLPAHEPPAGPAHRRWPGRARHGDAAGDADGPAVAALADGPAVAALDDTPPTLTRG
jgi:drug/metabolite transporter (DMT)-like permease